MDAAERELTFVLILMGILLVIAIVAVFIFVRQWRREHRGKQNK
jgi:type II secretory pathway pseudopilin PulG